VIRVLDSVAAASGDERLQPAGERVVEFTLTELARLVGALGGDGMTALVAYLQVLRRETAADGHQILVVEQFSAGWLQERAGLSRTRALNAQRSLVASGLLDPMVSAPGVGARGHQRGLLNSALVAVPGCAPGDDAGLRRNRSGGPPGASTRAGVGGRARPLWPAASQVSAEVRDFQTSEIPAGVHDSRTSGSVTSAPESHPPASPHFGQPDGTNPQVSAGVQDFQTSGTGATTRKGLGVHSLLSTPDGSAGLLTSTWAPLLAADPRRGREVVYPVFNDAALGARAETLVTELGLDTRATARARALTDLLADVCAGVTPAQAVLDALMVKAHRDGLPPAIVRERVVAGIVAGLGVPKVSAWGGWLYAVLAADWVPRQNATLSAFTAALSRASLSRPAGAMIPAADPAADPDPAGDGPVLPPEIVAEHLEAALAMFPHFAARAERADFWARAVVALYLAHGDPGERAWAGG